MWQNIFWISTIWGWLYPLSIYPSIDCIRDIFSPPPPLQFTSTSTCFLPLLCAAMELESLSSSLFFCPVDDPKKYRKEGAQNWANSSWHAFHSGYSQPLIYETLIKISHTVFHRKETLFHNFIPCNRDRHRGDG